MIHDLFLRWIVTTLFVISAVECVYGIAANRLSRTGVIGNSLHTLMAIAMAVMAWPRGADLPATGPLLFFLLATVWFISVALGRPAHRRANLYHAMMMLAMAWMYAAMSGGLLLPAPIDVATAGAGGHHSPSSMPGMTMSAVDAVHDATGTPPFITGLNWLFTIGFAIAGAWWLWWLFVRRRTKPFPSGCVQAGIAARAIMAAGMAIMFAVML
jgi:hypothetical protein